MLRSTESAFTAQVAQRSNVTFELKFEFPHEIRVGSNSEFSVPGKRTVSQNGGDVSGVRGLLRRLNHAPGFHVTSG